MASAPAPCPALPSPPSPCPAAPSAVAPAPARQELPFVIQDYSAGLGQVRANNPEVKLSVEREPELGNQPVLSVRYPGPSDDPAGRDVWCEGKSRDWSAGRAISFRIKPEHALQFSVSFFDRNHVVYTTLTELQGGVWQPVRIPFAELQKNKYFQPPDAKLNVPLDLSDVPGIAFSPRDPDSGQFSISAIVVSE
ncbi:MAG TPA: carbohydrate binding domain-containing protein [Polyangiaceae bacterium]|nr:carbohydrate binding domain-containing protein [Polyangiaceae bacterium]